VVITQRGNNGYGKFIAPVSPHFLIQLSTFSFDITVENLNIYINYMKTGIYRSICKVRKT
jgi:hypothetical protein